MWIRGEGTVMRMGRGRNVYGCGFEVRITCYEDGEGMVTDVDSGEGTDYSVN
jgi:hypothetical protein